MGSNYENHGGRRLLSSPLTDEVSRSVERVDTNVCFAKHLGCRSDGAARTAGQSVRRAPGWKEEAREREREIGY